MKRSVDEDLRLIASYVRNINDPNDNDRDTLIGRCLREYVAESFHAGFEGFDHREVTPIRRMLADLGLYIANGGGT